MAPLRRPDRRRRPSVVTLMTACVLGLIGTVLFAIPQAAPARADASAGGGDYVSLTEPSRILDTRNSIGVATTTPIGAAGEVAFPVLGAGTVPTVNVQAVLLTVSVYQPTTSTGFKLWPDDGSAAPVTGEVRSGGENFSNSVVVPVAANGKIRLRNTAGSAHAIADVQGYFTTAPVTSGRGGFVPITQSRMIDTRSNVGTTGGAIAAGATRTVTLATGSIPSTASSVFLNLIVVGATERGTVALATGTQVVGGQTFNYAVGTSSSGIVAKLTNGQVTIRNSNAGPINVVMDVQGYFSSVPSTGAGYRPAKARILDLRGTNQLQGGQTVTFQAAGAAGLPVRGVAGVLLNVHSIKEPSLANFTAWPTGTTMPNTIVNVNPGGSARASLNIVKPGTDGKISIRNNGDADDAADIYVEVEGWFADPLAPVGFDLNSATSAFQEPGSPGAGAPPLDFSYVDNSGQLKHGHVPNPDLPNDLGGNTIQTLSGGEAFTGTPSITEQANGNVFIAGHHTESNVWAKTESDKLGLVWPTAWTKLGGSIISHSAVGRFSDGRIVLFGVDPDGALWSINQIAANGVFGAWTKVSAAGITGTPVVVTNPAGVLQVFARTLTGNITTATYSTSGALSAWASLGNPGAALTATGAPAVAVGPTLIGVFVRTPAGEIATQQQNVGGTWSGTWTTIPGAAAGGRAAAVVHPLNGTYQVFSRTTDGHLQWATETTRNSGTWSTWNTYEADGDGNLSTSDPTGFVWVGNERKFGIVYRLGNDITAFTNFVNATPPPAAGAKVKAEASSGPEYQTYSLPKK